MGVFLFQWTGPILAQQTVFVGNRNGGATTRRAELAKAAVRAHDAQLGAFDTPDAAPPSTP